MSPQENTLSRKNNTLLEEIGINIRNQTLDETKDNCIDEKDNHDCVMSKKVYK